jgi:hypothetical protein
MSLWTVFVAGAAFLPFTVLYLYRYLFGQRTGFWDVLHPGDLVLICTAVAAGAAGDLLGSNVGRFTTTSGIVVVMGAIIVFTLGCVLFTRFQQSQEDVVRAHESVAVAREMVNRDQGAIGPSEQLIQQDERVLDDKLQELEHAQQHSNSENVRAWTVFAISVVVAASTLALEVAGDEA